MHWIYWVAPASCVLIAAAQPVAGQTVIPIVKQRYTQTLVITPCELKTTVSGSAAGGRGLRQWLDQPVIHLLPPPERPGH